MSSDDKYKIFDSENGRRFTITTEGVVILERRFSFREAALCLLCCVLGLLVFTFFGLVVHDHVAPRGGSPSTAALRGGAVCKSKHCVMAAASFAAHMNRSADPCQDFYAYTCGGTTEFDHSRGWWRSSTVYSKLRYQNMRKLVHILLSKTQKYHYGSAERKLKHFFYSCRNEFFRGRLGGWPFVQQILRPLGTVFLLGGTNFTGWNFNRALRQTHTDFWTDAIFTLHVVPNPEDTDNMIMELVPQGLGLSAFDYKDSYQNTTRFAYKTFITKIANLLIRDAKVNFNDSKRSQIVSQFFDDVMTFETKLANETIHSIRKPLTGHPSMSAKTLGYLNQHAAPTDWIEYFRHLLDDRRINTGPYTKVISKTWTYFLNAMAMIRRLRREKGDEVAWRIIHNYFVWRMAHNYARYLSFEYVHAEQVFDKATHRRYSFRTTFGYCYYLMQDAMPEALGALFVRDHFADSSLDDIKAIVDRLKRALKANLKKSSWMDSVTEKRAAEKISAAVDKVGYPGYAFRDSELDTIYSSLRIGHKDYFGNIINVHQHMRARWINYFVNGEDRTVWQTPTYAVHLHFFNQWNELQVPAGILQRPLFDRLLPAFVNYGAMGSLIGHELIKAVDSVGGYYTKTGRYRDWWTNHTEVNFVEKLRCIRNYYSNFTAGPYKTPFGVFTVDMGEYIGKYVRFMIAEIGGIRTSLAAYRSLVKEKGAEAHLPGIDLAPEKAFFVAYAQSNCFSRTPFYSMMLAHSGRFPENLRGNGALAQLSDFAKTFNCPVGSPMNPREKCNIF